MSSMTQEAFLDVAVLTDSLPNHQECFHLNFREFFECKFTTLYELKLLVEQAIKEQEQVTDVQQASK